MDEGWAAECAQIGRICANMSCTGEEPGEDVIDASTEGAVAMDLKSYCHIKFLEIRA
jgi:hypothetical protein